MEELTIRDQHVIAKLTHLAEQQNRSVEAVLEDLLAPYPEQDHQDDGEEAPPGSLARLAIEAEKANFHSGNPDIGARSKEILREEFADYF